MFSHTLSDEIPSKTYIDWFLLSFLAGNINAGGLLSCHTFVTHVTGFATLTGVELAKSHFLASLAYLTIPGFFLLGAMISAYITEKNILLQTPKARFAPVMLMVSAIMLITLIFGKIGYFGIFGNPIKLKHDFLLIALLCGSSGLINAAISSASASTIRVTHLTGLTTDLGIGFIRTLFGKHPPNEIKKEQFRSFLRLATILSFILGSFLGGMIYLQVGYLGFSIPFFISIYGAYAAYNES